MPNLRDDSFTQGIRHVASAHPRRHLEGIACDLPRPGFHMREFPGIIRPDRMKVADRQLWVRSSCR
jgi:hypothetical protein